MHRIVEVKPFENYQVWLKFDDGISGLVDLSDLVGKGVFVKWKDTNYFNSVYINPESHTITWANEIDLCPDELYAEITGKDIQTILNENISAELVTG